MQIPLIMNKKKPLTIFIMLMCHETSSLLIIKYLQAYHIQTLCEKLLGMSDPPSTIFLV